MLSLFAPAKINLLLAVTGRRADGFHELVSLVAPLNWGDTLALESRPGAQTDSLECSFPGVPLDASNLVLKAAAAYRQRPGTGVPPLHFILHKETPAGAGLGGGSSDAAAALRGMNQLAAHPLDAEELRRCAAEVGSDVPLFLENKPVILRGRGERVAALPAEAGAALREGELVVFKPPFGVATAWAYNRLRTRGAEWYVPAAGVEKKLADWQAAPTWETLPLENNLELPVFEKFAALPVLLQELRQRFQLRCQMSGSGSACFALLEPASPREEIAQAIRDAWGPNALVRFVRVTGD